MLSLDRGSSSLVAFGSEASEYQLGEEIQMSGKLKLPFIFCHARPQVGNNRELHHS